MKAVSSCLIKTFNWYRKKWTPEWNSVVIEYHVRDLYWERILMCILNQVETSHILISIRLYFILTILITEDEPKPSILSDCNLTHLRRSKRCTGPMRGGGVQLVHRYGTRRANKGHVNFWRFILIFSFISLWYFQQKSTILRGVSVCPKAAVFRLANFCWRSWYKVLLANHYVLQWPS